MNFTELATPRRIDDSTFEATIPDGWQQGKGAFGGLVIANMIRAVDARLVEKDRALRTITAELFAPVLVGDVRIVVDVLRVGSGVTTLAARMMQGGEDVARCVAIHGRSRGDAAAFSPKVDAPPPWRDVPVAPVEPPLAPRFSTHMEFRITGNVPFTGATEATTSGWVRARDPGPARDAAYVAALADAYYPSAFVIEPMPRPMSTIAFTLELLSDLEGLDPEAPLHHRGRCVAGAGGYLVDFRELWGEDGRLVALNQQTFVIVK